MAPRAARIAAAVLVAIALVGAPAGATVVERVVAVIGDHVIWLTDLRQRARPFLLQIQARVPPGAQQAAAESQMFKELLERMIDERLAQQAADRARIAVTSDEIDAGLRNVAEPQGMTVRQLVSEAVRSGLTVQEYRDEIRRQVLEGKLLNLRVKGRVRVAEDDLLGAYSRAVLAERRRLGFRIAWIVLQVRPGLSPEARADRWQLAASIARTAREGTDAHGRPTSFATLARAFSDDGATRGAGGDLGPRAPGDLAEVIEDEAMKLDVGQVSTPFAYKDAVVVVKVLGRDPSALPPFEEAREDLANRVFGEKMAKARKQWLEELRRGVYIDVRL